MLGSNVSLLSMYLCVFMCVCSGSGAVSVWAGGSPRDHVLLHAASGTNRVNRPDVIKTFKLYQRSLPFRMFHMYKSTLHQKVVEFLKSNHYNVLWGGTVRETGTVGGEKNIQALYYWLAKSYLVHKHRFCSFQSGWFAFTIQVHKWTFSCLSLNLFYKNKQ